MMKKILPLLFVLSLLTNLEVRSQITLPALFSDNMVLQQNEDVSIWGWAKKGSRITLTPSWDDQKYSCKADFEGAWKLEIPTPSAGGPFDIKISAGEEILIRNIMIGEVWLCAGQSNMEMPMKGFFGQPVKGSNIDILKSKNENLRFISVPRSKKTIPQKDFKGEWKLANPESVSNFSATAYYFGQVIQEILDVPVGLIEVSYGGSCVEAWISQERTFPYDGKAIPGPADSTDIDNRTPSVLYNGMLHPVIGYNIKGAIWYQGETNYINSNVYTERFSTMVREWRNLWGKGDFPFYYVQIAPFDYLLYGGGANKQRFYNSAFLREAQMKALDVIPESGMAVTMDIGEEKNIHPVDKKTGGERLSFLALGKTYHMKGFGYEPPLMNEMEIKDSTLIISFKNIPNGITSYGKEVKGFEIAGKDEVFFPANAQVRRKSVELSSQFVEEPVAVRYAFKDYIIGDLFSTEGIPVPSFRTDNW